MGTEVCDLDLEALQSRLSQRKDRTEERKRRLQCRRSGAEVLLESAEAKRRETFAHRDLRLQHGENSAQQLRAVLAEETTAMHDRADTLRREASMPLEAALSPTNGLPPKETDAAFVERARDLLAERERLRKAKEQRKADELRNEMSHVCRGMIHGVLREQWKKEHAARETSLNDSMSRRSKEETTTRRVANALDEGREAAHAARWRDYEDRREALAARMSVHQRHMDEMRDARAEREAAAERERVRVQEEMERALAEDAERVRREQEEWEAREAQKEEDNAAEYSLMRAQWAALLEEEEELRDEERALRATAERLQRRDSPSPGPRGSPLQRSPSRRTPQSPLRSHTPLHVTDLECSRSDSLSCGSFCDGEAEAEMEEDELSVALLYPFGDRDQRELDLTTELRKRRLTAKTARQLRINTRRHAFALAEQERHDIAAREREQIDERQAARQSKIDDLRDRLRLIQEEEAVLLEQAKMVPTKMASVRQAQAARSTLSRAIRRNLVAQRREEEQWADIKRRLAQERVEQQQAVAASVASLQEANRQQQELSVSTVALKAAMHDDDASEERQFDSIMAVLAMERLSNRRSPSPTSPQKPPFSVPQLPPRTPGRREWLDNRRRTNGTFVRNIDTR